MLWILTMIDYFVLVMYDLPLDSGNDVKAYNKFRKNLIRLGFYPVQKSIYGGSFKEKSICRQIIEKIRTASPDKGDIRTLVLTKGVVSEMEIIKGDESVFDKVFFGNGKILEY